MSISPIPSTIPSWETACECHRTGLGFRGLGFKDIGRLPDQFSGFPSQPLFPLFGVIGLLPLFGIIGPSETEAVLQKGMLVSPELGILVVYGSRFESQGPWFGELLPMSDTLPPPQKKEGILLGMTSAKLFTAKCGQKNGRYFAEPYSLNHF